MRFSSEECLLNLAKEEVVPYAYLVEEIIGFIMQDVEVLGCVKEIAGLRDIWKQWLVFAVR